MIPVDEAPHHPVPAFIFFHDKCRARLSIGSFPSETVPIILRMRLGLRERRPKGGRSIGQRSETKYAKARAFMSPDASNLHRIRWNSCFGTVILPAGLRIQVQ